MLNQKWLSNLNLNKANYYIKNEELNTILQQQRIIIARLEKDLQNKIMTIDFLTQQLSVKNEKIVNNLIDFD
jgi:ABC-type oligopeptide transport system ATPase subunit